MASPPLVAPPPVLACVDCGAELPGDDILMIDREWRPGDDVDGSCQRAACQDCVVREFRESEARTEMALARFWGQFPALAQESIARKQRLDEDPIGAALQSYSRGFLCWGCGRLCRTRSSRRNGAGYCSPECRKLAHNIRRRTGPAVVRLWPCARCGEMFEAKRSDAEYCTPRCRVAALRARRSGR